jgi:hypothetical protein
MTMTQQLTLKGESLRSVGKEDEPNQKNSPAKKCFSFGTKIETFDDDTFKKTERFVSGQMLIIASKM